MIVMWAVVAVIVGILLERTKNHQIAFGLAILVVVAGYGRDARLRDRV